MAVMCGPHLAAKGKTIMRFFVGEDASWRKGEVRDVIPSTLTPQQAQSLLPQPSSSAAETPGLTCSVRPRQFLDTSVCKHPFWEDARVPARGGLVVFLRFMTPPLAARRTPRPGTPTFFRSRLVAFSDCGRCARGNTTSWDPSRAGTPCHNAMPFQEWINCRHPTQKGFHNRGLSEFC